MKLKQASKLMTILNLLTNKQSKRVVWWVHVESTSKKNLPRQITLYVPGEETKATFEPPATSAGNLMCYRKQISLNFSFARARA